MRASTIIEVLLKALIIPIIAVVGLANFNVFEYVMFVPVDYQYEIGLTVYLTLIEAIYGFVENIIEEKKASVICVFYLAETGKDINNTPSIICDEVIGVSTINCEIQVTGNLKRLRKCKLSLELPMWLTSQVNISDTVLNYTDNQLNWKFERMLPTSGINNQSASYKNKVSLIKTTTGDKLSIKLEPQMEKNFGVKFKTNGFKIKNGECVNADY